MLSWTSSQNNILGECSTVHRTIFFIKHLVFSPFVLQTSMQWRLTPTQWQKKSGGKKTHAVITSLHQSKQNLATNLLSKTFKQHIQKKRKEQNYLFYFVANISKSLFPNIQPILLYHNIRFHIPLLFHELQTRNKFTPTHLQWKKKKKKMKKKKKKNHLNTRYISAPKKAATHKNPSL